MQTDMVKPVEINERRNDVTKPGRAEGTLNNFYIFLYRFLKNDIASSLYN